MTPGCDLEPLFILLKFWVRMHQERAKTGRSTWVSRLMRIQSPIGHPLMGHMKILSFLLRSLRSLYEDFPRA